jgi:hypothetical protein
MAELPSTAADRLIADFNAALCQHLLNVTKAQCEAEIEPHGVANNVWRVQMTLD